MKYKYPKDHLLDLYEELNEINSQMLERESALRKVDEEKQDILENLNYLKFSKASLEAEIVSIKEELKNEKK